MAIKMLQCHCLMNINMIPKTLLLVIALALVGVTGVIVVNTSKNETTEKTAMADMDEVSDVQIAKNDEDITSATEIASTSTDDISESEEIEKINDEEQEDFSENKSETELEDRKKDIENTTNTNEEHSEPAKADTEVETIFEPLSVFCNSPYPRYNAGESVAWEVHASGGELPFTYEWTGTSDLSGNSKKVTNVYSEKSYDRTEKAHVTITSNDKQSKNAECEIRILAEEVEEEPVQQEQAPVQDTDPEPQEAEQNNEETQPVEDIYSDYNFSYSYSYQYPDPEWMKRFTISQTSRNLRLTRAVIKISTADAEKYDSITDHSQPPRVYYCQQQCQAYTLERIDTTTFLYVGSKSSGIPIANGYLYFDIPIPAFAEGHITDFSIPISQWEIWDATVGKPVEI